MHHFDFLGQPDVENRRGVMIVKPTFKPSRRIKDLVVRGGKFVAAYDDESKLFIRDQMYICELIDDLTDAYCKEKFAGMPYKALHVTDPSTKLFEDFEKMCKMIKSVGPDLDRHVIFANDKVKKEDGASFVLPYAIEDIPTPNYDYVMDIWYSPTERQKIEWAIGSVISGDSRTKLVDHFIVMYGKPKTGKGSVISLIQALFGDGKGSSYAEEIKLGSLASGGQFAMQSLRNNPLIAIDSDADLSKKHAKAINILNTITSHEKGRMELKGRDDYEFTFESFIFAATNYEVEISGEMSGLNRRLIDVYPTGTIVRKDEYNRRLEAIKNFELGGIAYRCLHLYLDNKHLYDGYTPDTMREKTDWFSDFVHDYEEDLSDPDGVYISAIYSLYKKWCEDKGFDKYISNQKELENKLDPYFEVHRAKGPTLESGKRINGYFKGFRYPTLTNYVDSEVSSSWLDLKDHGKTKSKLDLYCTDCPAQYDKYKHPAKNWVNCTTKLIDVNPRQLHWVQVPDNLVVIDFDIKDDSGKKSFDLNKHKVIEQGWPETYAEVSQGGEGIHLHYIYNGDVRELEREYSENVEIKVYTGNSALRRKLSKWNLNDISSLNVGQLPKKEKKKGSDKTVDFKRISSEKSLREQLIRNLNKEIHPSTKSSVDFIKKILDDAYESDLKYDVSDMQNDIYEFASRSTHQSVACMRMVKEMHFKSKDSEEETEPPATEEKSPTDIRLTFFDVEVFPNLFVVVYKHHKQPCIKLINPSPKDIEDICKFNLVGFNNRKYDNHILYARMLGYTNEQLFSLSKTIVGGSKEQTKAAMFGEAYNLSYTDIYDFSSKKQSLKKFEIELGIHHQELGLPWDQPVPEELWEKVAEYCINDVVATEATFEARYGDFVAREILVSVAKQCGANACVNDKTNSLTAKIIFGTNRRPQSSFNYRNLADPCKDKPFFPGYSFANGISTYKGIEVGEGGRVYANPGIYYNVKCYDVAGMHPSSIIAENLFGPYTQKFKDIVDARVAIKHKDFDKARTMLDGALAEYLTNEDDAKALSKALKIAVNSVYGLTAAKFDAPFKDPRNIDNIVAKRGALFMVDLQHEVESRGFTVVHIKTDSIKVADPSPEIEQFIFDFGKKYGYNFEIEHSFEKICLVNDAVYIAKCAADDPESPNEWTATGAQFAVPYIFKTLFSKEELEFKDFCETKEVKSAIYLQYDEDNRRFVGKVGLFCPIKDGEGGADLVRSQEVKGVTKYNSVTGTKGYKWLESETVLTNNLEDKIDISYYERLAEDAIATINKFGNFNEFAE